MLSYRARISRSLSPKDAAIQEDIFLAGEFVVEPGADFQKRGQAAVEVRLPFRGRGDAGEDFEQSGFPGAVAPHHPDDVALLDLETHILEGPEVVGRGHAVRGFFKDLGMRIRAPKLARNPALDLVHQHLAVDHAQAVFFGKIFDLDDGWVHK
jgi:hypothetical protein